MMRCHRVSLSGLIVMEMNARDVKRRRFRRSGLGPSAGFAVLGLCAFLTGQLTNPLPAHSDQRLVTSSQSFADQSKAPDSKSLPKPQKENELPPVQSAGQELKAPQAKTQAAKSEESRTRKDNEEEGTEKEKEGAGKRAVSSLILTVKLALLEDSRLFPYEIEVEGGSDEIMLAGKVSTDTEKSAATKIASMVPTVKSVANKLEVTKELPEIIVRKQDDIITRHVKERFAKSATVTAANFDVKTEQGVVALSGAVRFQVIVLEAVEAVRQIPGVKGVKIDKVRIESEG